MLLWTGDFPYQHPTVIYMTVRHELPVLPWRVSTVRIDKQTMLRLLQQRYGLSDRLIAQRASPRAHQVVTIPADTEGRPSRRPSFDDELRH